MILAALPLGPEPGANVPALAIVPPTVPAPARRPFDPIDTGLAAVSDPSTRSVPPEIVVAPV
ncbi:MAG TPA: hypothetical protein PLV92_15405 [Pirellulaceae bacterium]|nr:hypothetical protein [Pirellulaceae bacterium]